jgi:hypothetical protein
LKPRRSTARGGRRRPRLLARALAVAGGLALAASALVLVLALVLAGALPGPELTPRASAQSAAEEAVPQTDASVPARQVTLIGATPAEAGAPGANETWGVGREGTASVLVRYTTGGGWSLAAPLPAGFTLAAGQLAGQMTPAGAGVLVGTQAVGGSPPREVVLVRDPGGDFAATATVPKAGEALAPGEEPLLGAGEELFASPTRAPLIAPLDEAGAKAGALVVPVAGAAGVEKQVLHWDGHAWTSEPIAVPAASAGDFRVLAIGASSPKNAWLLGQLASNSSYPSGAVALFRRVAGGEEAGGWSWQPVALSAGSGDGEAHPLHVPLQGGEAAPFTVAGTGSPPRVNAQLLTVTGEGVWIDGERADVHAFTPASATIFFKPEGTAGGHLEASWCSPGGSGLCLGELPQPLPGAFTRSIAWADGSRFGKRVITGLSGGVSLRLQGEAFARVLALGAGETAGEDPGSAFGAAFSSPTEGWLGSSSIPVHLTAAPAPSRLTPWPVPFRHPLLAIAPQPGAPVGSLSSEALAVGDRGAVARYVPEKGWIPESLFGAGQRVKRARLRAVAWPTPTRAYAVGDESTEGGGGEQMWLWRGETGLWEPDPAMPVNFRGNLLGVAFDPGDPARGYAVGTTTQGIGGVLLRYGKSWTEETALPPEVQRAAFVAIAFAGSEAIVAYREQPNPGENRFVGGLLVNDGSGWRIDQEAASAMGGGVPEAVAGLPDGGAAFATTGGSEGPRVYERQAPGAPWTATPTPAPGLTVGSLSLFREGGALRAVLSGGGVGNESEGQAPPPGSPPNYLGPLTPRGGTESGGVLRQTASGWSDEGHELNTIGSEPGSYLEQDMPYRPDSIYAVLIDAAGAQGWAVGGNLDDLNERLETGDVERYPADGVAPSGAAQAPVPPDPPGSPQPEPSYATFAIGGHAECAAPCADRARAGVGPQVSLSSALSLASRIGVRAFLYTGPSVTEGQVSGPRSQAIPFSDELQLTASILASQPNVYVAAAPQDLDARPEREGTEASFLGAFQSFPQASLALEDRAAQGCEGTTPGCEVAYYAFKSAGAGGQVRVIVLDDTADVNATQLQWLEGELRAAKEAGEPAIVVGAADLGAQIAAGDARAAAVAKVLVTGSLASPRGACASACDSASAYFYDAPEANVSGQLHYEAEPPIPAIGSGTLGYVNVAGEQFGNFHGWSGIVLGQLDVAKLDRTTNRAPVLARLIPVIGELAMEAKDGTLLRRSQPALFSALARRPRAGELAGANSSEPQIDPYIPIPAICVPECSLRPEYTFTSSRPDIGNFVAPNTASSDPHAVLQNAQGEPIEDSQSGLFCAYNAGTTIVTISAGGRSASLPVTVQAGSVRQPCGTQLLKERPAAGQTTAPPPPPPTQPTPTSAAPASSPPPVPLPAPPVPAPAPAPHPPAALPAFTPLALVPTPLLAFVPPPIPTPARPTPPSGTSAVTSPIEVAEKEEEHEEATESVSNQAVAYRSAEHEPLPEYLLGVIVLAALAGASVRRRPRREVRLAPATVSAAQRRDHRRAR